MRKQTMWFLDRSDRNRAVQAQKMARGWKFGIYEEEELKYLCSKNKGANQLRGYRNAPLFSHMQIVVFLMRPLKFVRIVSLFFNPFSSKNTAKGRIEEMKFQYYTD